MSLDRRHCASPKSLLRRSRTCKGKLPCICMLRPSQPRDARWKGGGFRGDSYASPSLINPHEKQEPQHDIRRQRDGSQLFTHTRFSRSNHTTVPWYIFPTVTDGFFSSLATREQPRRAATLRRSQRALPPFVASPLKTTNITPQQVSVPFEIIIFGEQVSTINIPCVSFVPFVRSVVPRV